MNPALEKLKGLEAKYLYMIIAGIIVVFALLDFLLLARLQIGWLGSLNEKVVALNKDIVDLTTNKQRLAQFKVQQDLARRARRDFDAMVHSQDEVPLVLKSVSSIANEYGVKIDQLMPQPMDAKPLVTNEEGKYSSIGITMRVRSGYHQLGRFLNRMERERLFWQMDEFVVVADPRDPQHPDIKMNMKILILEK